MTRYVKTILLSFLVLLWVAGCNGDGGNGEEDADADVQPDTHPDEVTPDPEPDPEEEDVVEEEAPEEDVVEEDVIEDVEEEEAVGCPPDDPPDHIYIDADGAVAALDETDVDGSYVAAIAPMDALVNPTPTPLGTDIVAAGAFMIECIDVGGVDLGLVILHDDDPDGSDDVFYPTGTGVKAWTTDAEKVDITGTTVFATSNTLLGGIETLTGVDADTNGLAMGMVIDATTGDPIDGATVDLTTGGPLDVDYPNADFTGLEPDDNTSTNGVYIVTEAPLSLSTITAEATGYTFAQSQAATKAGFIYFVFIQGTPE